MAPGRHASSRSSAPNFTSERDRRDNGWDQEREHNHGSREKSRDRDRDRFRDRGSREGDERDMASNGPLRTSIRYQDEENVPSRPDSAMSITSYSPSQSSGGHSQDAIGAAKFGKDKEPGELSSGSKSEDGDLSPVHKKKRKYSPIVWDLDDKQARHKPSKVPESSKFVSKQRYPDGAKPSKASPSESHLMASRASSAGQISNSPQQLERLEREERAKIPPPTLDVEAGEGEQELPPTIAASRWAEEAHSPSPSPAKSIPSVQQSVSTDGGDMVTPSGSESQEGSQRSTSPEPGEYVKESETVEEEEIKPGADDDREIQEGQNNNVADEEYEEDLNKRELMELDEDEDEGQADEEEEQPELDPESEEGPFTPPQPQQRAIDMLRGCRSVDAFERLNKIDEGTYGVVYRARDKRTGEIVALKKVKMERERDGFPMTSLREINVLLSFHHPSVVDVKEVVVGNSLDSIFMVMEYMEHDLKGLMESMKQPFSQSEVKCLMLQLFNGVKYLHDNWVLHRDLKTSNLLLNNRGELKICDFGLARQYGSPLKTYTKTVVTLWYRAPELLLGARKYSTAIDMWSLGCIMAELLAKEPLFNGKSEIEQIDKIFRTLGTPNEKIWPDYVNLPAVKKCNFKNHPYNKLREKFRSTSFFGRPLLSENGMDLLNRLLTYDPLKRITAEEALQHNWFQEVPLPKMKELMPTFPVRNDHDRRLKRLMKSPDPLEEQRKRELRQGSDLGTGGLFG